MVEMLRKVTKFNITAKKKHQHEILFDQLLLYAVGQLRDCEIFLTVIFILSQLFDEDLQREF